MPGLDGTSALTAGGGGLITFILFAGLVGVTLGVTVWAGREASGASDFYAGGGAFSGAQNGLALAGAYISASSFLGFVGITALCGYDGFLYATGCLVAWIPALVIAELIRNIGRFTMADILSYRPQHRPRVRTAAAVSTVSVSIFYLIAQMVGAGALLSMLLGIGPRARFPGLPAGSGQVVTIITAGGLMTGYVMLGGMRGTTWVQIIKAALLMTATLAMTLLVMARFGFDPRHLLGAAADASGKGRAFLEPGLRYGTRIPGHPSRTLLNKLDLLSLALALALGTAGLPHILTRFYTVPDARAARASVTWAIGLVGAFYLMTLTLGFGAIALIGHRRITAHDSTGNTAVPQLAHELGRHLLGPTSGDLLLAFIASAAFATILAAVAGLIMASAASLAHDYFGHVLMLGRPSERQEIAVARVAALLVGILSTLLAVFAKNVNVAFLVALAFAIAASANLPVIVLTLFWRRFNTTGVLAGIYGGLATSMTLVIFSPVVSGKVDPATGRSLSLLPHGIDIHWFPLENPGLVSIPAGFLCAVAGTFLSRRPADTRQFAELSARSLTGTG